MGLSYGQLAVIKRNKAREERIMAKAARPPKPANTAKTETKYSTYPMDGHDGSVPDRPIDWSLNREAVQSVVDRVLKQQLTIINLPTGMGKTIMSLQTYAQYRRDSGRDVELIIIAPPKVLKGGGWHRAIQAFNDEYPDDQIMPVLMETYTRFTTIVDNPATKKRLRDQVGKDAVIIVDEFHNYKTPTSKRTKALRKMNAYKVLGLTATPFTNDPVMDQISYLTVAGNYSSKTNFFKVSGLDRQLDIWGNPAIYNKATCVVDEQKWPYYRQMVREMQKILVTPDVDMSQVVMPNVESKVLFLPESEDLNAKFRSLCQQKRDQNASFETPMDFMMSVVEMLMTDEQRLDQLMEWISGEDVVQPLIFFHNTIAAESVAQRLEQEGMSYQLISGLSNEQMDATRMDPVLIQYQSGGAGIEFADSNTSVFFQNQYSYAQLDQACGRNVRRGRDHHVTQYHMVAHNWFDMKIFDTVSNRENVKDSVMADILYSQVY